MISVETSKGYKGMFLGKLLSGYISQKLGNWVLQVGKYVDWSLYIIAMNNRPVKREKNHRSD